MRITERAKRRIVARLDHALQVSALRERLDEVEQQVERQAAQLAALEVRVADLGERSHDRAVAPAAVDGSASVLDEVHREHRQMRERMALVTNYVTRLERVEDALALTSSDRTRARS